MKKHLLRIKNLEFRIQNSESRITANTAFCILLTSVFWILSSAFCHAQNLNVAFAAHVSYGVGVEDLSNIWGWKSPVDGKEYALVGAANGLSIVDVSIPTAPVVITQIPAGSSAPCIWREVQTYGNYAYVTTECGTLGLQIVDLTNLPATNLTVTTWRPKIGADTLNTIHALHIDTAKARIYLYGSNAGGGAVIADIAVPMAPVYLGSHNAGGYIHDGFVQGDTMYAGHIWTGTVEIVNAANAANPIPLASFTTPNTFTHNTWLSSDNKTCFATDEVDGAFLSAFDISNFGNISELDRIQSNPGDSSIVHNTYVINKSGNDYAVSSWYKDGFTIVDAGRPDNLVQVGDYDSSPLMGKGYGGCWGIYPFLPSGTIVLSDIDSGLYVLTPTYVRASYIEGTITDCSTSNPVSGALVEIVNPPAYSVNSSSDLTDALGKYGIGTVTAGTYTVSVSKANYFAQTFTVTTTSGNVTPLNVQLCATGINEAYNNPNVSVYPNPFSTSATIEVIGNQSSVIGAEFIILDVFGREVHRLPITGHRLLFERGNLSSGIYFFQLLSDNKIIAKGKLVVE